MHHQEFFTVHTAMVYVIQVCWQLVSRIRTEFVPDPARKLSTNLYVLLCVQWKTADDGQRNCPKHVEFYSKNKIWEISASSWFYYKTLYLNYSGYVTVLQIGRMLVRSQLMPLEFFIDIISFRSHCGPGVTQPLAEMSTRSISWG